MLSPILFSQALILILGQPQKVGRTSRDIWFSSKDIVDAQLLGEEGVTLAPKRLGTLFAGGLALPIQNGLSKIVVTTASNAAAIRKCASALKPLFPTEPLKLEVSIANLNAELKKISTCGFDDLTLGDELQTALQGDFLKTEERLRKAGIAIQNTAWIEGKRHLLINGDLAKSALTKMGPLGVFYVFEKKEGAKPGQTLLFDVSLFELSRSKATALGLKLPQSLDFQLQTHDWKANPLQSFIELGFEFGESLGLGKILAKPRLRTKPGEKALFQSGGEIPIKNVSLHSNQTDWKTYGLILELTPSAESKAAEGEVSVDFKIELSEPDLSTAIDGVPGMIVRKLSSRFDLRVDEETLLSTMVQSRSGLARSQPAVLGDIPLLGRAFQDHQDSEQSTELWISIRPSWQDSNFKPRKEVSLR